MESILTREQYQRVYELLDAATPVPFDCGQVCGAVCCLDQSGISDDEAFGIFLLPGEEIVHDQSNAWLEWQKEDCGDYEFPDSWTGTVWFVKCSGPESCRRELRPVQCRTYPLAPYLDENKKLRVIWDDTELPYCCPIIEERAELQEEFVQAVYDAWSILITDPLIRDYVELESSYRRGTADIIL